MTDRSSHTGNRNNANPKVAIIYASGLITTGKSSGTLFGEGTCGSTTMIEAIRHAEKDVSVSAADPPLSEAGEARAALLARMFGDAKTAGHLDAIYVTSALRNRLTAAPLAARLGISETVVPGDDSRALARRVLHEHGGGRVLIVGHADTVPQIVAALSGKPRAAMRRYSQPRCQRSLSSIRARPSW